jgi:hypothetical protein
MASSDAAVLDVLCAAPKFSAAAALVGKTPDWASTFDAAAREQVVLDEASPRFGAIGRLR